MEPARTIIEAFGGPLATARIAGVAQTAPYRWMRPRSEGGTGGVIPHWHIAKLLAHAEEHGIAVTAASFAPVFFGEPSGARA